MRIVAFILIVLHGIIHLMGFLKAFDFRDFSEFTLDYSRLAGVFWLVAAVLFLGSGVAYFTHGKFWWLLGLAAVLISQILIIYYWKDARFGSIANGIILLMAVIAFLSWNFEKQYKDAVKAGIQRTNKLDKEVITHADMAHLPELVQRYLIYVGVLNKPKVLNMKAEFTAEMRGRTQNWFQLTAEQHNFFDQNERLFFLKAKFKGIPTLGYHVYKDGKASMLIKLLSVIPVAHVKGEEMFRAETVTFFNDMCFLAPALLIDKSIQWEAIDENSVKATFSNLSATISAILYFNEKGQLVNFVSEDRYDVEAMEKYTFSTPLSHYQQIKEYHLPGYGEAVWHYPEGKFTYGKYTVRNIAYNITEAPL